VLEHGNCRVPIGHESPDGYRLGEWVNNARVNRGKISAERKVRLDELGFIWDPHFELWEEGYRRLKTFAEVHGHCRVPLGHKSSNGYRLGQWVASQRQKQNEMSTERKARLDALGFSWDPLFEQWEEGYRHLKAFVEEHGHCQVSHSYKSSDGYRLGHWVGKQRTGKSGMPAERRGRLEAVGFVWRTSNEQVLQNRARTHRLSRPSSA
jgi:hypothetical protein